MEIKKWGKRTTRGCWEKQGNQEEKGGERKKGQTNERIQERVSTLALPVQR